MDCLHAEDLVVALLVIKHGSRKVVEDILSSQWAIGLGKAERRARATKSGRARLYPFVPYKKTMAVVIWWMKIVDVHGQTRPRHETRQTVPHVLIHSHGKQLHYSACTLLGLWTIVAMS